MIGESLRNASNTTLELLKKDATERLRMHTNNGAFIDDYALQQQQWIQAVTEEQEYRTHGET